MTALAAAQKFEFFEIPSGLYRFAPRCWIPLCLSPLCLSPLCLSYDKGHCSPRAKKVECYTISRLMDCGLPLSSDKCHP